MSLSNEVKRINENIDKLNRDLSGNAYNGDWNDMPDGIWTASSNGENSPIRNDGYYWRVFCNESTLPFQQAYRLSGDVNGSKTYFRYGNGTVWSGWYQPYVNSVDIIPKTKVTSLGTYFSQVCGIVHAFFRIDLAQPIDKNAWVIVDHIPNGISLPAYTTQFPVASYQPNDIAYGEVRNDGTVRVAVYYDTSNRTQFYANFWYLAT